MSDSADRQYEQNSYEADAPEGIASDNEYKSRTGQSHIPVQSDDASIETGVNAGQEDSDVQLRKPSRSQSMVVV